MDSCHLSFTGDGHADADEIIVIMKKLDLPSSRSEVNKLIAEVDKDGNGTIEFDEFLWMIKKLQGTNRSAKQPPGASIHEKQNKNKK